MKILVTGGTGFLGKRLVRRLLGQGHDVCCLVRPGSDTPSFRAAVAPDTADTAQPAGRLSTIPGTLNRIEASVADLLAARPEAIVHAAAAMGGGAPALFVNNVVALRQLLDVVLRLPTVRRFVHVSSLGVYGTAHLNTGDTLDETCPLDPKPHLRDPYTYSKVAQEQILWEAHRERKLPLVVVRPGVIYGPGRGVLSNRVGLRFGPVILRMGGSQQLPYTYVDNCAAGVALAATVPGIEGQAFNLLDDDLPRARSVLKQYRREVERLRVLPVPHWAISPLSGASEWYHRWSRGQLPAVLTKYKSGAMWKRLRYSNARARTVLGWKPSISVGEGMRRTNAASRAEKETAAA
jgi:nucleoside-diphosphate-sugar epimerase